MPASPSRPSRRAPLRDGLAVCLTLLVLLCASSCSRKNAFAPPPPPEVDVQTPVIEPTTVYLEYPGRLEAYARAEIRARVQGFLQPAEDGPFEFEPGQYVEKGTILFNIERDQYEAALNAARSKLAKSEADLEIASKTLARKKQSARGAVSELDIETAAAEEKQAQAAVGVARADLQDAERSLAYTEVKTDMAGRVSKSLVDPGNLVGAAEPTLLTTVVQDDPIYVNFEVNEREVLPFLKKRPSADQPIVPDTEKMARKLKLLFSNGEPYTGSDGMMDFVDTTVNPETGTMKVRAIFENDDRLLADGLFVRILVPEELPQAVLVPRTAIQRDLGGFYVLLVNAENKVERRVVVPTQFTTSPGSARSSEETAQGKAPPPQFRILQPYDEATNTGVKPDDRIIVSNLQRARTGITVVPVAQETAAPTPPAPAPQG